MADVVSFPDRIEIQPDEVPQELKEKDRWLLWRWENRGGKSTKPPYSAHNKNKAKVNDPSTWSSFEHSMQVLLESGSFHGLGFVLTDDDDIIAWDLDKCINPKTAELAQWAQEIVDKVHSYTEISPSGTGLRIFVRGKLIDDKGQEVRGRKEGKIECYNTLRYVTVTGSPYPNTPSEIKPHNNEIFLDAFYRTAPKFEKEKKKREKKPNTIELLEQGLWQDIYPSQSEADLAYVKHLAERYHGVVEKIDEAFRASKLFRDKWDVAHSGDGKTYGQLTIELALRSWESSFRLTDLGNAKRLVRIIRDKAKYCNGDWLLWDGKRFRPDKVQAIYLSAQEVIDELREEARNTVDDEDRKRIYQHMIQLESRSRIESMLKLAESQPDVAILPDILDTNHYIFNCDNGMLTTDGRILEHDPKELMTKLSNVRIHMKAECPTWHKFLDDVLPDKEVQSFVQRAVGYSMTGLINEQVLFFLYGTGANGKSTFIRAIQSVFGDYASELPIEGLMAKHNDQHPTFLMDLRGVRFVVATEPEDGRRFNEGLLKQITGGEKIVARRMHQDYERFDSTAKLWIMGNHKPIIRGTDYAIWRRIRLIPFTVTIPPEKKDKYLWNKLEAELEGIFLWCYKGLQDWMKHGLNPPEVVIIATDEYRREMDFLQDFLNENVSFEDKTKWLPHTRLYDRYTKYAAASNERLLSSKMFAKKLREKGFIDHRRSANILCWQGMELTTPLLDFEDKEEAM